MIQFSFTDVEYGIKRRKTRLKKLFIDALIPWQKLNDPIRRYYHNCLERGIPDEASIMRFRHLLEKTQPGTASVRLDQS